MDLAYWDFRYWPFDRSFAADRFFASQQHEEALARMLFLVEESRRCGVVIGPAGSGKSFLLKLLQNRTERLGRVTVRCDATGLEGNELLGQIALACQAPVDVDATPSRIWTGLRARFAGLALIRQPLVVLIDHFDLVDPSCHQAVWRLHQSADAVGLKLTILLVTREQPTSALVQELVELRIELHSWTSNETAQFIRTAVDRAGSNRVLFSDEALFMIHELASGLPSAVISLSNHCLLAARGQDERLVTPDCVEAVAAEFWSLPSKSVTKSLAHKRESRHPFRPAAVASLSR